MAAVDCRVHRIACRTITTKSPKHCIVFTDATVYLHVIWCNIYVIRTRRAAMWSLQLYFASVAFSMVSSVRIIFVFFRRSCHVSETSQFSVDTVHTMAVSCVCACCWFHALAQANRSYGMDFPDIKSCFPWQKDKQTHTWMHWTIFSISCYFFFWLFPEPQ